MLTQKRTHHLSRPGQKLGLFCFTCNTKKLEFLNFRRIWPLGGYFRTSLNKELKSMLRRKGPTSLNKELKSMLTQKRTHHLSRPGQKLGLFCFTCNTKKLEFLNFRRIWPLGGYFRTSLNKELKSMLRRKGPTSLNKELKSMLRRKGPTSLNKELKSMLTQKMTRPFLGPVKN